MEPPKKVNPAIAALIVVVLIGISTAAVVIVKENTDNPATDATTSQSSTESTAQTTDSVDTATSSQYKDGTYSAQGSYVSPGGRESIGLTVTLENGVIVNTELDQQASDREAIEYQQKFATGYESLVVGKSIDEVELSRVAGSSLTSNGFNDAIEQIRTDASA